MANPDPESSGPDESATAEATAPESGKRPPTVTAAAVLAFVAAVYEIAAGVVFFVRADIAPGPAAVWYVVGVLHLAFAGLLGWGGLAAWTGRTDRVLLLTAVAVLTVMVITMIVEVSSGGTPSGLLFLVVYVVVVVLVTRPQSKEFFVART